MASARLAGRLSTGRRVWTYAQRSCPGSPDSPILLSWKNKGGQWDTSMSFETWRIAEAADVSAPDGSEVRLLGASARGSMAAFRLAPGAVSRAVAHRTVEEIWYFIAGQGRMWRRLAAAEEVTEVAAGVSVTIPTGVHFQFRCDGSEPLEAVAVTMPPWPGEDEAYPVAGKWEPTV
jgi:mannose-6-phosphate isomerase-like protein (cupin superfamily)